MSRIRFTGIAVAAVALCGAAAWTVVAGQQEPVARMAGTPAAEQGALPADTADRGGRTDRSDHQRAVPPAPATEPAAGLAATTEPAGKRPKPHGTPAPFVQSFAAQPGRARIKPGRSPKTPVKVAPTVDGCDRNYGTKAQCIPSTFPQGVTDRCAWLKAHGFTAVKVVVKDRQKLDPDNNKIACD
jgi:hypothetical protein